MKNKVISTLAIMGLFGSIFAGVVPVFVSSASEHYRTGYDDACAGRVVPGPHTTDYQDGYAAGQAACSGVAIIMYHNHY